MTTKAYINIGSNLGDRLSNIGQAVALIEEALGVTARCSRPYESKSWGYESENYYVNVGVTVESDRMPTPRKLLALLTDVQEQIAPGASHRDEYGGYADRIIDADLIAVDNTVIDSEELTVPHPRMASRRFVLEPLAELWPEWRHPLTGLTADEMLSRL